MTDRILTKSIFLKATPEEVWQFLTDPEKLAIWFHKPTAPLQQGEPFEMLGEQSGDRVVWGKVIKADAPHHLEYTFTVTPMAGAFSTVKWALEPVPGGTHLTLEHSGLPQNAEAFELILALDSGWDRHLLGMRAIGGPANE
ncbi:MAG: SRPBCC domain-containing protein [Sedimentitalea sp.]